MNALSLFTGIGGIDAAAELARIRTVAMCEIDDYCRKVLRKHWPHVPVFEDIKLLTKEVLIDAKIPPIDVIHGGPPCQPVSVAGRRRGQNDDRYLWRDVFRIVADIMPRFCVFENVPGILTIAADDICKELERIGYSVGICSFEAAAVGAWHRRARVFFVCDAERSGLSGVARRRAREVVEDRRQDVADAESSGREQGEQNTSGCTEGIIKGSRDRLADSRPDLSYSDGVRQSQQSGGFCEFGERLVDFCETAPDSNRERRKEQCGAVAVGEKFGRAECGGGRAAESGVGGGFDGIPTWMDGTWERGIPRVARGVKNRVNRLRALGNAVVWQQIYPIFKAIVEAS